MESPQTVWWQTGSRHSTQRAQHTTTHKTQHVAKTQLAPKQEGGLVQLAIEGGTGNRQSEVESQAESKRRGLHQRPRVPKQGQKGKTEQVSGGAKEQCNPTKRRSLRIVKPRHDAPRKISPGQTKQRQESIFDLPEQRRRSRPQADRSTSPTITSS